MDLHQFERKNQLLAALPEDVFLRLTPHMQKVDLPLGRILHEPDEPISTVYFPVQAMISLVQVMKNGSTIEAGIVGNDGIVDCAVYLGDASSSSRALVQMAGNAIALPTQVLKAEFNRNGPLQAVLLRYVKALLAQLSQTAACNRFHSIEERLARWLLQSQDLTQASKLHLTQDFLSSMLGVRRASVTVAAGALQAAGLIQYNRGHIEIIDRESLKTAACECYDVIRAEYSRLSNDT